MSMPQRYLTGREGKLEYLSIKPHSSSVEDCSQRGINSLAILHFGMFLQPEESLRRNHTVGSCSEGWQNVSRQCLLQHLSSWMSHYQFLIVQYYSREKLLLILLLRSTDFNYIPKGKSFSSFINSFTQLFNVSEPVLDAMDRIMNKTCP